MPDEDRAQRSEPVEDQEGAPKPKRAGTRADFLASAPVGDEELVIERIRGRPHA